MKQNTPSQRIAAEIKQQIRSGKLAPGARVPSARELVRERGIAIATASKVLAILRREGLVKVRPGVGTIVRTGEREIELTRDQIVRAAIAVADEEGLAAATLRQVAVELGVATVKLHRVFESTDELALAMADTVLGDMILPRDASNPRATLEAAARLQWRGYSDHAWLAELLSMTRPQLLPNGMKHTEAVLAALEAMGFGAADTLRTGIALLAYVRGMAVGLDPERRAEQDTGMTSDEWIDSREALFAPYIPLFPTLARLTTHPGIDMSLDALFERGLRLFLDGLHAARAGEQGELREGGSLRSPRPHPSALEAKARSTGRGKPRKRP
jgi:DNA-binding transcriptional regulator YhcF (GntR family)